MYRSSFTYMHTPNANFSLLSQLPDMMEVINDATAPAVRNMINHGKKLKHLGPASKPVLENLKSTGFDSVLPQMRAMATSLPGPREYLSTFKPF